MKLARWTARRPRWTNLRTSSCARCSTALRPGDLVGGIRHQSSGHHAGEMTPPHGRARCGELFLDVVSDAGGLRWVGVSESVPVFEEFDWTVDEVADYRVVVSRRGDHRDDAARCMAGEVSEQHVANGRAVALP